MTSPHLHTLTLHAHCSEGTSYMNMTHSLAASSSLRPQEGAGGSAPSSLRVHVVQLSANYCARVADVTSYGEVNREVRGRGRGAVWLTLT